MAESKKYTGEFYRFVPEIRYSGLALDIILNKQFLLESDEADRVSETADRIWRDDAWAGYCLKVVAAKSYESLINNHGNPSWKMILKAAHAYSKAAKNAYLFYDLHSSAVRCTMFAHRLFCDALVLCYTDKKRTIIREQIDFETNTLLIFFKRFNWEELRFHT